MKKLIGLVLIAIAIAAVISYLSRDRIQEKIAEKRAETNGHGDADELLREEESVAPAVAEPF